MNIARHPERARHDDALAPLAPDTFLSAAHGRERRAPLDPHDVARLEAGAGDRADLAVVGPRVGGLPRSSPGGRCRVLGVPITPIKPLEAIEKLPQFATYEMACPLCQTVVPANTMHHCIKESK